MCATSTTSDARKSEASPPLLSPFRLLLLSAALETAALAFVLPAYPGLCKELGIDLKTRGWMISVRSLYFTNHPGARNQHPP